MAGDSSGTNDSKDTKLLDFASLPPIFVLSTHMSDDEFDAVIDKLEKLHAPHTYDAAEAKLFLARITKKRRAQYELRCRKIWTEEIENEVPQVDNSVSSPRSPKRRKLESVASKQGKESPAAVLDGSTTESETESEGEGQPATNGSEFHVIPQGNWKGAARASNGSSTESEPDHASNLDPIKGESSARPPTFIPEKQDLQTPVLLEDFSLEGLSKTIKIIKLEWLDDSVKSQRFLPISSYLVYEGKQIPRPVSPDLPTQKNQSDTPRPRLLAKLNAPLNFDESNGRGTQGSILERARADREFELTKQSKRRNDFRQQYRDKTFSSSSQLGRRTTNQTPTQLLHQATTGNDSDSPSDLPEMPDWVKQQVKYACERPTPGDGPNQAFVAELKRIKLARVLTADEIGVRAYSTSIASIAAYPYSISSAREILTLPGCDVKIANLWVEFKNTGHIEAAKDAENDEGLTILRLFYNIWGVGATTAREFYYDRGWRDLDDIIEYGWDTLTREQQIGVKYYDEFLDKIPRSEVEQIALTIHKHAVAVRDDMIQSMIVGGYRRGKEGSGDVDVIISHPDEDQTLNLVHDVVLSLEKEGWVTHTLTISLTTSRREQSTLPYHTGGGGHGFDSLDKALVVWQDPTWASKSADLAKDPKAKNPNPHRRVDIIISPWRTVGCAVTGWSGGTTFQRDLRRYAKYVKGWKFDSSGIRDRLSGRVVDLESKDNMAESMAEAEKRVFEGLGLTYREPWERCTG